MSTTSQKHHSFVSEPMGEKPVTDLAGVGDVIGKRLSEGGYDKAYIVLGMFLLYRKEKVDFVDWFKKEGGGNTKQANDCYQCLSEWCDQFL